MQVSFKKPIFFVGLFFFIGSSSAWAQQGYMLGVGPTLEVDQSLLGVNGRFYYGPNEHFCFGPEVSFYPYQEIDDENELQITELNLNAHYIFEASHKLGIYPLTGINYTIENERLISISEESGEEKEFGLNYGFGAHYNLEHFFVFAEFKGIVGQLSDEFVTVGIIFSLSKPSENKEH
ncbi:MAG: outer membrane beta-barrel protein [Saonia sp.]